MFDTLLLRPSLHCNTPLHFTTLHPTTLYYTSHFMQLHFTTLIDTSLPLIYGNNVRMIFKFQAAAWVLSSVMTPRSRLGAYRPFEERTASISTLKML